MLGEKWTIYWNEYAANTYLYGSRVRFIAKDDVEFQNQLMPPGTVLKTWYSKTNYQAQRIEPTLPMIDGEGRYRLTVNIDTLEREQWLMQLVFYDRFEKEAGKMIIRDAETDFRCPMKTYSYCLQLINGGMTKFHFHYVTIQELFDEQEE